MSRHFYRDPLPLNADYIAAHDWPDPNRPAPKDVNRRDSAFGGPTIQEGTARRPRWAYSKSQRRLISRYLLELDAQEINDSITQCRSRYGEDAVASIELHIWPEAAQAKAGVLKAYGYERSVALESSGVDRIDELVFVTHVPRIMMAAT
jgi:hypothetical protein